MKKRRRDSKVAGGFGWHFRRRLTVGLGRSDWSVPKIWDVDLGFFVAFIPLPAATSAENKLYGAWSQSTFNKKVSYHKLIARQHSWSTLQKFSPHLVWSLCKIWSLIVEIHQKHSTPGVPPFKVTQCHWNQHESIGHFLLAFHSTHEPISYRFRDKRQYRSKIANFPTPEYFAPPLKGFPLELCIGARSHKTRMMELPGREISLTTSSAL